MLRPSISLSLNIYISPSLAWRKKRASPSIVQGELTEHFCQFLCPLEDKRSLLLETMSIIKSRNLQSWRLIMPPITDKIVFRYWSRQNIIKYSTEIIPRYHGRYCYNKFYNMISNVKIINYPLKTKERVKEKKLSWKLKQFCVNI